MICDNWATPLDETAIAEHMVRRHGNSAGLHADATATALHAMGDEEGAAGWRRIRDIILDRAGRA